MVGGGWQWLAVGGWSPLAVGGGWWRLVVGGWWRLAVGGSWRLAVGGPLGRSLRAVLSKKKKTGPLRTALVRATDEECLGSRLGSASDTSSHEGNEASACADPQALIRRHEQRQHNCGTKRVLVQDPQKRVEA